MAKSLTRFINPVEISDENVARRAKFLRTILIGLAVMIGTLPPLSFLFASSPIPGMTAFFVMETLTITGLVMLGRGYVNGVSHLLVIGMWTLLTGIVWVYGGTRNPGIYSYVVIVLIAGLLLRGRTAFIIALLSTIYCWVLMIVERANGLPASDFIGTPGDRVVSLMFDVIIASMVLGLAMRGMRDALLVAQERERALLASNQALQHQITERMQIEHELQLLAAELETRVVARTTELEQANKQLQALSQVKDEFVSNVSHEIRTPLTSIKVYHKLLGSRPEVQDDYLGRMGREVQRLEDLIEGLLRLSRLDQGRLVVNAVEIDLNYFLDEIVEDRRPLIELEGLGLGFSAVQPLPVIKADPEMLGQVLSILLTNATNYTPSGGRIIVSTWLRLEDGAVGFSVSDNGPGIPREEQAQLFQRFFRGSASRAARAPGTGLGLSIASEIVKRHAGRIEIASTGIPGEGATFTVWLPLNSIEVEYRAAPQLPGTPSA